MSEVVGTSWGAYTSGVYEWCWRRVGTHGTVMIIMSGTVYLVLVTGWWDKSFSTVLYQNHDDLSSTIIPMWYNKENWKPERLLMAQVYKSRDMAATQTPPESRAEVWASRLYWKVLSILHKFSFWWPLFSGASLDPSRSSCKILLPNFILSESFKTSEMPDTLYPLQRLARFMLCCVVLSHIFEQTPASFHRRCSQEPEIILKKLNPINTTHTFSIASLCSFSD